MELEPSRIFWKSQGSCSFLLLGWCCKFVKPQITLLIYEKQGLTVIEIMPAANSGTTCCLRQNFRHWISVAPSVTYFKKQNPSYTKDRTLLLNTLTSWNWQVLLYLKLFICLTQSKRTNKKTCLQFLTSSYSLFIPGETHN